MKSTPAFDVNASFPADPRHRPLVEAMVAQATEQAGCAREVAKDFADEVGSAFSARTADAEPGALVSVRLERVPDRIEAVVSCGQTVRMSRPVVAPE
jgi:hypothetical protein